MAFSPQRTPISKRSTPQTDVAARAPLRTKRPTYSDQPVCLIDASTLTTSRFLNPVARRLAYRDAAGRVNLQLCQRSLLTADKEIDGEEACSALAAWERHCRRAIAARPDDEKMTLIELVDEADRLEREREALPLSQRKTQRSSATSRASAGAETIVVLEGSRKRARQDHRASASSSSGDDGHEDDESSTGRVASGTVAMQRRLFRAPRPNDEPSVDIFYLRSIAESRKRNRKRGKESSSAETDSDADDVYEVEKILKEDRETGRFLIRWEGYGADADTWEPEENVAPQLVNAFRDKRRLEGSHAGEDFMLDRSKLLWCATCAEHRPSDCFSANQRRMPPAGRSCLNHHYGIGGGSQSNTPLGSKTPLSGRKRPLTHSEHPSPAGPPLLPHRLLQLHGPSSQSSRYSGLEVRPFRLDSSPHK